MIPRIIHSWVDALKHWDGDDKGSEFREKFYHQSSGNHCHRRRWSTCIHGRHFGEGQLAMKISMTTRTTPVDNTGRQARLAVLNVYRWQMRSVDDEIATRWGHYRRAIQYGQRPSIRTPCPVEQYVCSIDYSVKLPLLVDNNSPELDYRHGNTEAVNSYNCNMLLRLGVKQTCLQLDRLLSFRTVYNTCKLMSPFSKNNTRNIAP